MKRLRVKLNWDEIGRYVASHPEKLLSPDEYLDYLLAQEIDSKMCDIKWKMYKQMFWPEEGYEELRGLSSWV